MGWLERKWVLKIQCPGDGEVVLAAWLFSQEKNWSACQIRSRETPNNMKRKDLLIQCKAKWLQEITCQGVVWALLVYTHSKSSQAFLEMYPPKVITYKACNVCFRKPIKGKLLKDGKAFCECISTWVHCRTLFQVSAVSLALPLVKPCRTVTPSSALAEASLLTSV